MSSDINSDLNRRNFLKLSGAILAAGTAGCATGVTGSAIAESSGKTVAWPRAP